jgi:hypothetical protein
MASKNLYHVLGLQITANAEDIKKAYFSLAKKYHPDSGNDEEVKKFYAISEAYEVLSDREKRKAYNLTISDQILSGDLLRPMFESDRPARPAHPPRDHAPMPDKTEVQREKFRQRQQFYFRRELFLKARVRVLLGSVLLGYIGFFVNEILWRGFGFIGGVLALFSGFLLALHRNFDMDSFGLPRSRLKLLHTIRLLLYTLTVGYFVSVAIFFFLKP